MSKLKAWAQRPERTPTRIRKGDSVLVIAGKDRGKTGKVLEILAGKNRAKVERLNMVKRHSKGQGQQAGGIVEKEASIHLSNLMIVCPKSNEPTRIGMKILEDGTKVRVSRRSKELIDG
jgi:large subunit ribosomal protein L24